MAKKKKIISTFEIAYEITFECFVLKYQNRHKIRSEYKKMAPFKSNEKLSEYQKRTLKKKKLNNEHGKKLQKNYILQGEKKSDFVLLLDVSYCHC